MLSDDDGCVGTELAGVITVVFVCQVPRVKCKHAGTRVHGPDVC